MADSICSRAGRHLCDIPKEDRAKQRFLGPFAFDLLKVALVGGAAFVAAKGLSLLPGVHLPDRLPPQVERLRPEGAIAQRNAQKITDFVSPAGPAVGLLVFSNLAAFASLKGGDRSRRALRRARWEYLYLDGAYGLIPQALLGVSAPLLGVLIASRDNPSLPFTCLTVIVCLIPFFWQLRLTFRFIPARLFELNGYKNGPLFKYQLVVIVFGTMIAFLIAAGFAVLAWLGGSLTSRIGLEL